MAQGQLLRDHPAKGETHNVNCVQFERTAEGNSVVCQLYNGRWRLPFGSSDARVVEQDDLMVERKGIHNQGIPAVHVGVEVAQAEQRNRSGLSETTVGIPNPSRLDERRRNRLVRVVAHDHWSGLLRGEESGELGATEGCTSDAPTALSCFREQD